VDHLRGRSAATELLATLLRAGETVVASEIVRFELIAGVRDDERDGLEDFFSAIGWVAVSESVARLAGTLARPYRRSHSGIDDADYLIAATALALEADLLTTNVRHFPMIEGLERPY
jgi:predicted nucleic acid-binding protein